MHRFVFASPSHLVIASLLALTAGAGCVSGDDSTLEAAEGPAREPAGEIILPGADPADPADPDPGWNVQTSTETLATTTVTDPAYAEVYVVRGSKGIKNVPLADEIKTELFDDWTVDSDESAVYVVSPKAIEAMKKAEANGDFDADLKALLDPPPTGPVILGSCSDEVKTQSRFFPLSFSANKSQSFGSGFSGSVNVSANVSGGATLQLTYRVRRQRILWACVPYWVKAENVRASGNMQAQASNGIDGNVSASYSWNTEIAKPHLGSVNFMAGPVPVHIGFNLPISIGLDIAASASGSLRVQGENTVASANFDYTCTFSNCSGSSTFSMPTPPGPSNLSGSVAARVNVNLWAQAALRTYLYAENVAYAQVGVRPYLYSDLWGYFGNNCGDANGDGINETVQAATLDLDWQVNLTGKAGVLGSTAFDNGDLLHSQRRHIGFWELGSSTALTPMLQGTASPVAGQSATYTPKMRPCWPYAEGVNGSVTWGDGTSSGISTPNPEAHAWGSKGAFTATLNAGTDTHGRSLGKATSRTINVK